MKRFTLAVVVLAFFLSLLFWTLTDKEEPKVFAAEAVPATTKATSSPAERSNIPTTSDRPAASLPECPKGAISAEWLNQNFKTEHFQPFQNSGLLPEDVKLLLLAVNQLGYVVALPNAVEKNGTVVDPGNFLGKTLPEVYSAADAGNTEAAFIAGAHLLHIVELSNSQDLPRYERAKQYLLTAAHDGNIQSIYLLRQSLFIMSRLAWKKVEEVPSEAYLTWKRDYLVFDELTRQFGNEGAFLLSIVDEAADAENMQEFFHPRSKLGLPEPEHDTKMQKAVNSYLTNLNSALPFKLDSNRQERKERIAWLRRNVDLNILSERLPELCQETADKAPN
ncbi:hypothetical protein EV696_11346 [Permianibacter aggregans]|uniref:Uncharacterized protein n=2 Tax=Permianibacter aggregans TaxID=1510150 RepID=A0A4R6UMW3_9GAMM|nr:hypothetical protein EV696_11346 [Permianibacter aggregans]